MRLSKPDAKTKQKAEEQKKSAKQAAVPPKKTTTPKPSKTAVANTKTSARKKPKEETTRKRRTKKRKAKTMDAADKFNLLDIILTETDDEMPVIIFFTFSSILCFYAFVSFPSAVVVPI